MKIKMFILFFAFSTACYGQTFSGSIYFETSVEVDETQTEFLEYYQNKYGDTLQLDIDSQGRIKRTYIGTGIPGFEYSIINPLDSNSYNKFTFSDTLFITNPTVETTILLKIDTLEPDLVLNRFCSVYRLTLLELSEEGNQFWYYTVWIDPNLGLLTNLYAYWNEGHWNTVSSLENGMYLKSELKNKFLCIDYTAYEIVEKEIEEINCNPDSLPSILID